MSTGTPAARDGALRHLLSLEHMPTAQMVRLLERAQALLEADTHARLPYDTLAGATVVNLMSEPSTRTRASFELAARRLGGEVLNLDVSNSSREKGETLLDTVYTLESMRSDIFIIRTATVGAPQMIAQHVGPRVAVISAGEANLSHPTQGLLDMLSIRQHKPDFANLVVCIIGDIAHSRVARSAAHALGCLGVGELRIVAPPELMPPEDAFAGARRYQQMAEGLKDADVIMTLRIQRERMAQSSTPDPAKFHAAYGLDSKHLRLAHPDAIVMHPGPMIRGCEIASDVADGPQSVIRQQVRNGVAVRMSILEQVWQTLCDTDVKMPALSSIEIAKSRGLGRRRIK